MRPTASGSFSVNVRVKDSASPVQTATATMTLKVMAAPLTITSAVLAAGTQSKAYSAALSASGGTAPYKWSSTGALPAGLGLSAGGVLSGTPTASGSFPVSVKVKDSASPAQTVSASLTVTVAAAVNPLTFAGATLAQAVQSQAYSASLHATGGTAPYSWSISSGSVLPVGLSLAAVGGVLSGTPATTGSASFMVTVSDSSTPMLSQTAKVSLIVAATPLTISGSALPGGTSGTTYSSGMSASGGTPSYSWKLTAGALPTGLTLAGTTGVISGTPTAAGTSNFTLSVSDNGNPVQTKTVATSIVVAAAQAAAGAGKHVVCAARRRNAILDQCNDRSVRRYGGRVVCEHGRNWNQSTLRVQ